LIALVLAITWQAMGKAPQAPRLLRMEASPNHREGVFVNRQPLWNNHWEMMTAWPEMSEHAETDRSFPVSGDTVARLSQPAGPLRVTWLGHSTSVIELAGKRVLTDPIFDPGPVP